MENNQNKLTVKYKEVTLLLTHGTDLICIILDEQSAFPLMDYNTVMKNTIKTNQ